jgi:1-phosphofructokinase family hexose kinase
MRIYTLTLNPAYDIHATTAHFLPCKENLAAVTSRDAGGKGVNISRALHSGGTENTAVIVLGKENGGEFKESLASFGLNCLYFEKEGRIRENLTLHCETTGETRISFAGFAVDERILDEVETAMEVDEETFVTYTGRTPAGIPGESVKAFLNRLQAKGAKVVIDSKSFTLEDLFALRPWLIKPNQEEIAEYFGCEIRNLEEAAEKAKLLHGKGIANAMISLGGDGALLACKEGVFTVHAPKIRPVSTIGAGDSSIAGFLAAAAEGKSAADCLKTAVAYGTAACLTAGTLPPRREDIHSILSRL